VTPGRKAKDAAASLDARERVYATVDSIPPGRVASYGQVAREAGLPGRARLVGRLLGRLDPASGVPWHRVVGASGRISVRGGGERVQRARLESEGVELSPSGRIDMDRFGWGG
jgi:methylated-DNA-protein-cysteine methyltransferase-like protein